MKTVYRIKYSYEQKFDGIKHTTYHGQLTCVAADSVNEAIKKLELILPNLKRTHIHQIEPLCVLDIE